MANSKKNAYRWRGDASIELADALPQQIWLILFFNKFKATNKLCNLIKIVQ